MTHAIVQHKVGGPEVLQWEEIHVPDPEPTQARVRHTAIGVNFIDVYHRMGKYPIPEFPITIGMEAAGVVEAVGNDVTNVAVGDRVVYATRPIGAYSEARVIDASRLVAIPDGIADQAAATLMLKGMTSAYLLTRTHVVKSGDVVLVHAAAGGMGLYLCQWAKNMGAIVIGTVSTPEKAALARAHGCDHVIDYTSEDFTAGVLEITDGRGCSVVYDGVGQATFAGSLGALATLGHMVSFGNASGSVTSIEMADLAAKSLTLSRPTLFHYTDTAPELNALATAVFSAIKDGDLTPEVRQVYALKDAALAHTDLQARATTGATILLP
ncbi:MAG: quinone oxidoreductase [Alphaproteobacteria bacterium]|jgi:NADPH:quinone reductase|nr:quinone oxidoreductase [Alphaproteobacteria bacterium]MBT4711889.1 quinone oxidoreductase [Alphaproteobacteria bacterium]MBT5861051.1 quinone oxidoreductase [Alphaproteobacteria bacterium]